MTNAELINLYGADPDAELTITVEQRKATIGALEVLDALHDLTSRTSELRGYRTEAQRLRAAVEHHLTMRQTVEAARDRLQGEIEQVRAELARARRGGR